VQIIGDKHAYTKS